MKPLLLTPDINETEEFDPILARLEFELEVAKNVAATTEPIEGFDITADSENALKEYKESGKSPAKIVLGYMPSAKRTELEHRHSSVITKYRVKDNTDFSIEDLNALSDVLRETCKWCVKGHVIEGVEFVSTPYEYRGRKYQLASDDMVDLYERNDWLHLIRKEAVLYNRLGPEKKRQS